VRALAFFAIAIVATGALIGGSARAADPQPVTYVGTQTIPVPPASSYAGTGGGDGWSVALTPAAVYNVFHHNGSYQVACHKQIDAKPCWPTNANDTVGRAFTVTDGNGQGFSTSGHSGLVLDQSTGNLYGFATRNSDSRGGLVCVDTDLASPTVSPFAEGATSPFCGFTALTGDREAITGTSGLTEPVQVGSRLFAFDFYPGAGVGPGAQNKLVCFDISTGAPCAGQPFTVAVGDGTNGNGTFPAPAVTAFGDHVIIPITMGGVGRLACFDASTMQNCSGEWPIALGNFGNYPGGYAAAFPKLTSTGSFAGFCLPMPGVPCYTLAGGTSSSPANMPAGVSQAGGWNGASVVIGPRVYIPHGYYPNGGSDEVECYDYNLGSGCPSFPKTFSGLSLLYTVNADPQRPECLWVNADNGTQIQNFDAFTGGPCGTGVIRVRAQSFIVDAPMCTPGSFTSLRITSPSRDSYTSGSVKFVDGSNVPLPGIADRAIDANGAVSLDGVPVTTSGGLPQFLISLEGAGSTPKSVSVDFTWTGTYDPACVGKNDSQIVNPPSGAPSATPPKTDVSVSVSAPGYVRTGQPAGFSFGVKNSGPDTATGVSLRIPVPAGATVTSATSSSGSCIRGAEGRCFIGTLASGASATVNIAASRAGAGPLTLASTAEGDYDTNLGNNGASATVSVLNPETLPPPPPPPTQRGTFNAVGSGTILVNGVPHAADQPFVLNSGDVVDATGGIITFTDADGRYGSWSAVQFVAQRHLSGRAAPKFAVKTAADEVSSKFTVDQATTPGSVTTVTLAGGDFASCNAPRKPSATSKKPVNQVWGSAKGNFTTKGRFSAATVRGTVWMVQDRCDGTLTQVVEGVVEVADQTAKKTVSVAAGQSYLALAPVEHAAFKPPLQTPKQTATQVKKRGLLWGAKVYKTRTSFEKYLKAHGQTWQQFVGAFPKLAAALTRR